MVVYLKANISYLYCMPEEKYNNQNFNIYLVIGGAVDFEYILRQFILWVILQAFYSLKQCLYINRTRENFGINF